jgi:flagellar basal body rod protein FlgG
MYTRNGHFVVGADGALTTAQGYGFVGEDGTPVTVTVGAAVSVKSDGTLYQGGAPRGKLALVDWPSETATTRVEGGYFALDSAATLQAHPAAPQVKQGYLEQTNSKATDSAIRLVDLTRQFESLQKAAQVAADMNRVACEDIGKVV